MSSPQSTTSKKKTKLDIGLLHAKLHRPYGVFATIRAHDLWRDVGITQSINLFCTTCKIMIILAHARGKIRESKV